MKKKGFTLVELLAVIVILAIIALIATPMIIGVIEKAKIGALKSSVDGLVESANLYYAQKQLKNDFQTTEFSCESTGCKNENEILEIKGKVDYGKIKIYSDGKISICVENEKNAAIKLAESDSVEVKTGSCNVVGDTYTIDELVSLNKYNELKEKYDALGEENSELKAVGDATSEEIIENKKVLVNGKEVVGTMPNIGRITKSLNAGDSYTIEKGYHDGTGVISANSLSSQTSGTATASQILSGKTAWVNGTKITGSIASLAATTYTPGTSNQTIAAGKYLSGAQTITGDADLVSANIKSGANIFGVAGNSNVVDTSAGTATAAQILSGKIAYVDGAKITGTRTAQNNTYSVKYYRDSNIGSGAACSLSYNFTPTAAGKVIVTMTGGRNVSGVSGSWVTKSVTVGGSAVSSTVGSSDDWQGVYVWTANVNANQAVSASTQINGSGSSVTNCSLTVTFVS